MLSLKFDGAEFVISTKLALDMALGWWLSVLLGWLVLHELRVLVVWKLATR